jgi:tRNA (guanosine-2'-O-)-methyltransferase
MAHRTMTSKTGVRRLHKASAAETNEIEIAFLLQDWDDAYNVGGMFRVADAVGAKVMYSSGKTPQVGHPQIAVTSLGHHRRVELRHFDRHEDAAKAVVDDGFALVAVEISEECVPYQSFEYPRKVCFALGNEERGLYQAVSKKCEAAVFIPMFGKGRSLNVHVSAAVIAFHARCAGKLRSE